MPSSSFVTRLPSRREPVVEITRETYGGISICANVDCLTPELGEERGAYLYRDLETIKLVILCGDCARHAELNAGERFLLVAL